MEDFKRRYEFNPQTDLIGKGGFSKVYKAYDKFRKRTVALKFYYGVWSEKYDIISEINRMEDLIHPNLIRYYDATIVESFNGLGEKEQIQVGIMEYADAGDITAIYDKKDIETYKAVVLDILYGLDYLHKHGIAHRDLKPKNILLAHVEQKMVAKIADFGISKKLSHEDTGASTQLLGSVEYMAPEQFNTRKFGIDNKLHTNVDLWALGVIVYEMLVHHTPFGNRSTGFSNEEILSNILFSDLKIDYTQLPNPFDTLVRLCLKKNASERVKTAQELIDLFEKQPSRVSETETKLSTDTYITEIIPKEKITATQAETSLPKEETKILQPQVLYKAEKELPTPKAEKPYVNDFEIQKPRGNPNNGIANITLERGKNAFKSRNYPESYRYFHQVPVQNMDTEAKFFYGFLLFNGKCGGPHDPKAGKQLMETAKAEDHDMVVQLMVKYILNDYK
ncbi:MAG: serine/threonine-protein kinase [Chitinophagales bacterium]|nr:serine/threonine-protein kinase [Bacteroidota bacterium]MCB9044475.1 serine/threonine-protein kinase [Chitinophagales bacterium]